MKKVLGLLALVSGLHLEAATQKAQAASKKSVKYHTQPDAQSKKTRAIEPQAQRDAKKAAAAKTIASLEQQYDQNRAQKKLAKQKVCDLECAIADQKSKDRHAALTLYGNPEALKQARLDLRQAETCATPAVAKALDKIHLQRLNLRPSDEVMRLEKELLQAKNELSALCDKKSDLKGKVTHAYSKAGKHHEYNDKCTAKQAKRIKSCQSKYPMRAIYTNHGKELDTALAKTPDQDCKYIEPTCKQKKAAVALEAVRQRNGHVAQHMAQKKAQKKAEIAKRAADRKKRLAAKKAAADRADKKAEAEKAQRKAEREAKKAAKKKKASASAAKPAQKKDKKKAKKAAAKPAAKQIAPRPDRKVMNQPVADKDDSDDRDDDNNAQDADAEFTE